MSTLLKMPIVSFRRLPSPYDEESAKTYIASIDVSNLPEELNDWRKINVRDAKTKSLVSKAIRKTLDEDPASFYFRNRGLTIIVDKVHYDNTSGVLGLELSDTDTNGLLDGGHTFSVIQEYLSDTASDEAEHIPALVKIEIIEGIKDVSLITNIVEARNTSRQVQEQSLEEHRKSYEAIHAALDSMPYGSDIAYKEFELKSDRTAKLIDIKEVLSYLVCFDTEAYPSSASNPIKAYTSKSAVVSHFKDNEAILKYIPLLPVILELRDTIYKELPSAYNTEKEDGSGRFGRLKGVTFTGNKPRMSNEKLWFLNEESEYRIPSGFIYPVLAAFRNLVEVQDTKCTWKVDPVKFFEEYKLELAQIVGSQAKNFNNPNQLGKDNATWQLCYNVVEVAVLRRGL